MGLFQMIRPGGGGGGKTINLDTLAEHKVLVIGSGGREHALVTALAKSMSVTKIYAAPGNDGMIDKAELVPIKEDDITSLLTFAKENHIDLTVVGPEVPLSKGIVDSFFAEGLRIFGPTKAAAQVEASKDFAKSIMAKYNIPTADYKTFSNYDDALSYVVKGAFPIVLKYDGLAAGKGVVIAENIDQATVALKDMLLDDKFGHGKVVVEEFLTGPEFSFMCLVCDNEVFPLASSQDHKRAFDGDKGPNTGGMGAYSPVPIISKEDEAYALEYIMKPMAEALVKEGCAFRGLLYGGLIKTPNGIKVIEFNCRFGDPETEVVLPRLKTDIYTMFTAITDGKNVDNIIKGENSLAGAYFSVNELMPNIEWEDDCTLGFVLASKGYPGAYDKGFEIQGLDKLCGIEGITVYHMGTKLKCPVQYNEEGKVEVAPIYETAGGRVLMVVASAEDLKTAKAKALDAISKINCSNLFYRTDIGWRVM